MKQKRLMLLGGLRYLIPVIEAAHNQGYYVITADYLPDNIAHKYSDEYCNVSIVDKEAVLEAAKKLMIDGIMSFACDPGVIAASYVQNKLGLPSFGPFESVEILQNKDKFRTFLKENGFNVPWAFGFGSEEEALSAQKKFTFPLIVKPTDSAGSKGVSRVDQPDGLKDAIKAAFSYSIKGRIIVEEFIEKKGCSSDSDCYSENGKLKFVSFSAQRFDDNASNPYTPAAYSWPSTFTKEEENYLSAEIQRLITLLGMQTAVYNVETRVGTNGKPYIMELTPRGGGNRLSEMIRYSTGVDLITAITRAIVGDKPANIEQKTYIGNWGEVILHTEHSGVFMGLAIDRSFSGKVIETDLWVQPGDAVCGFEGANNAIGTLVINFAYKQDMWEAMNNPRKWLRIICK